MLNVRILCGLLVVLLVFSCSDKKQKKAKGMTIVSFLAKNKKSGFDPFKHGFTCDSVRIEQVMNGKNLEEIIVSLGTIPFDTINMRSVKVPGFEKKDIMITDFNFDGFCDFVMSDVLSAEHGGMNYYYFVYDNENLSYKEITSIPKFIADFKLDIKNQRVKIYCPNHDCFAYYKFNENKEFELVQGKYEVIP